MAPSAPTPPTIPRNVLVFCASSPSCDPIYHAAAAALGRQLAEAGHTIVYGGGGSGSMGALADAALARGGRVIGIQPHFMREREWTHAGLSELVVVDDMQSRKRAMLEAADAVVTLPGGSGTFEELFEAVTSKRLGLFSKPIVIVNQGGFFEPFLELMRKSVAERFMHETHLGIWRTVDHVDEVPGALVDGEAEPALAYRAP